MAAERVREEFCFFGRVQGVGFRYKLRYLAESYGVTGWVRNEYDGSVSAQLQGQPLAFEMILKRLYEDRYIELEDVRRKKLPLREEEHVFYID